MSRFNLEILLGIILVSVTTVILVIYGFNEEDRMAHEVERQQGRSIEVGAGLFESNCSGCHGLKGEGITGLCPPLNDGQFFTTRMKEVGCVFINYGIESVDDIVLKNMNKAVYAKHEFYAYNAGS